MSSQTGAKALGVMFHDDTVMTDAWRIDDANFDFHRFALCHSDTVMGG